jgi:hypothetical protein
MTPVSTPILQRRQPTSRSIMRSSLADGTAEPNVDSDIVALRLATVAGAMIDRPPLTGESATAF